MTTKPWEAKRIDNILQCLPDKRSTALEIGARDGRVSKLLREKFAHITALDLEKPNFNIDHITPVQGNVAQLQFADNSFDVVICTEVLEHIDPQQLNQACKEIQRVAKHEVLIGVPYKQDIRLDRTNCTNCGAKNPPFGHINSFSKERLLSLFNQLNVEICHTLGPASPKTNFISTSLLDLAGNPWGTYDQEEPCIACGCKLNAPAKNNLIQKTLAKVAYYINLTQNKLLPPSPYWIHILFSKTH